MLHLDSIRRQCQQNMALINYENELISLVWFKREKWTWEHKSLLCSGAVPGYFHFRAASYITVFQMRSVLAQHPFKKKKLHFPAAQVHCKTPDNFHTFKILSVINLYNRKSTSIQNFWASCFLGQSLKLSLGLWLNGIKKQSRKHAALLPLAKHRN